MTSPPVNTSPGTTTLTWDNPQGEAGSGDPGAGGAAPPVNVPPVNTSPIPNANTPAGYAQTAPYAERILQFTFQLGTGSFGASGQNQLTIGGQNSKLRATAHIEFANYPMTGMAQFRIYGMTLDQMNAVSVAGRVYAASVGKNSIACQAGDALSGMATVFNGGIFEAWPDITQPDSPLFVLASPVANAPIQLKPVPPTSFPGSVPASTALSQMCKTAGVTLENNGVSAVLQTPYFHGTIWSQIGSAVRAANCFAYYDGVAGKLAIWPKTGSRSGGPTIISAATGMVGYPKFQKLQTKIRTLFNPKLLAGAGPGSQIQVKSEVTDATGKVIPLSAANGLFTILNLTHELSSQMPDGPWETMILATPTGAA